LICSASSGIILIQSANKVPEASENSKLSFSLIVRAILGHKSLSEGTLEADETLELGLKTVLPADSWEDGDEDGELRNSGLELRVRRRFEIGAGGA
jgi:hypothetical protein